MTDGFQQLWQIRAVREAVIGNLNIRIKRDDDKVSKSQAAVKKIFEAAWYRNLGGLYPTVNEYISAATDLQVSHLSMIKEMQAYLKDLNEWAARVEQAAEDMQTMQQLNSDLSIQIKEIEDELKKAKAELAAQKKAKGKKKDDG